MTGERREPLILDLGETALPPAPAPSDAPPPPDAAMMPPAAAERALRGAGGAGLSALGRLFWLSAFGLLGIWLATGIEAFVADLFARSDALGWAATALAAVLGLALAGFLLRELAALARVQRIAGIRRLAARALSGETGADAALAALARLYRTRPEMAEPLARVAAARPDTPDAPAMLAFAERQVLAPLDRRAEQAVARAARRVAAITAVVPLPVADVLAVLAANLAMVREVAQIYGGRAGTMGSWRLLRAVAAHLLATGAVAATDDILGPMVGGGVLGKLSRRFGEAAVNAALTARVGTAAIEVCRPLPFAVRPSPRAGILVLDALRRWREVPEGSGEARVPQAGGKA
ncbi:TIGR01620 family protein [Limibaculum sp. FT325]|uniref:TIGR01620 family protein n=1 Tax=Thermohalobaculum sediminis TaxID=2939436 RepID=UPI0020BEC1A1|nr:TIGR01620 family protein [Limibaculum sediminis]MCL5776352.1 TIGR01620 family protein [Limibaculum sediminis]